MMDSFGKSFLFGFGVVSVVSLTIVIVMFGGNGMEKMDEIPQYNCHILEKQMDKYGHEPTIYKSYKIIG